MSDEDPSGAPESDAASPRGGRRRIAVLIAAVAAGALVGGLLVAVLRPGSSPAACDAVAVAQRVLPSVVTIRVSNGGANGNGTGEIVRSGGYILTNDHVISAAADGGEVSVVYADGGSSPARIVGRDVPTDLAVIKVEDEASGRPLIAIGSSGSLRVGQPVVALGAPLGLNSTVTAGIVSALDRYVPVPVGNGETAHLLDAIQTDASINPGNSGGALTDCGGRMVGVNSAIITVPNAQGVGGGGSVGLGFAIPIDVADPLADELIATGRVNHPTFGLQAQPIPDFAADDAGVEAGLFVTVVDPGGPADQAGIRPGDIITEVEGQPATTIAVLVKETLRRDAGDTVSITYVRAGSTHTTELTLGSGP